MEEKKKTERQAPMEPPKPNEPQPQPRPLLQLHMSGGSARRFYGNAVGSSRVHASPYFRMRALVRELRPLFVLVLQATNMQHSVPAEEIREKLKLLMDLYKQMITDKASAEWPYNNISSGQHFPGQFQNIPRPLNIEMAQPPSNPGHDTAKMHQYKQPDVVKTRGTYLVGGSTLGWNFVTYPGKRPVYYGRTKKSFRTAQSKLLKVKKSSFSLR